MFYKKMIPFLLPLLSLAACSEIPGIAATNQNSPTPMVSSDFQGVWEGNGYQYNNSKGWTIRIAGANNQYKIDYPSLRCGGFLTVLNRTANKIEFREKITYGSCVDNGKTVLTKVDANTVKFDWYEASGPKGANGMLIRK